MRILQRFMMQIILEVEIKASTTSSSEAIPFGPFNLGAQRRWKKKADVTAQSRLEEDRTRDLKLDKLMARLNQLTLVLTLHQQLISSKQQRPPRHPDFLSLQLISRWWSKSNNNNITSAVFLRKYPHIFQVFTHPIRRNICCTITKKMRKLIEEEEEKVIRESELENVGRIKKLLMLSVNGTLHIHALRLIRRELGLPQDFRESILRKYTNEFRLVDDSEIVAMVSRRDDNNNDEDFGVAKVEKWREKEFREKWLSEFETKYAFPINLPTGFKIRAGFRQKLKNWQRLPYVKPYEALKKVVNVRTCRGIEQFEKRAIGILHEFLCLTVEKMVQVERLAHFRSDFGMKLNMRELILKHPGIFYISTKGNTQTVFLREAYSKGCLIEPNPIYAVRRKMLDLIFQGRRNTREMRTQEGSQRISTQRELKGDKGWWLDYSIPKEF